MNETEDNEWYWLKEKAKSAFVNTSENYKQKTLYNLLNAAKTGNQKYFFDILLRALVANLDDSKELAAKISELQLKVKNKDFEKLSYSIILGIMTSKNKQGGN